jgi:hypothetical protein
MVRRKYPANEANAKKAILFSRNNTKITHFLGQLTFAIDYHSSLWLVGASTMDVGADGDGSNEYFRP